MHFYAGAWKRVKTPFDLIFILELLIIKKVKAKSQGKFMLIEKTLFFILLVVGTAFAADIVICIGPTAPGLTRDCMDTLELIAISDGHSVTRDSVLISIGPHKILYYVVFDTVTVSRINTIQRFVGQGGRCILIGERGYIGYNY
ncbi:hypothetical protein DRQ36_10495, partial [bacterium]